MAPHPITGQEFASPVPPGTGWPDDPATSRTPVAADSAQVRELAASAGLAQIDARVSVCRACPRLVQWRETTASTRRRSFESEPYWGRPVAGWGDPRPRIVVVGLAPAAHGGNRTGRIFTGDRSGDWLFDALFRAGLACRPTSLHAGDGQALVDTRMMAAVRCAPPANRPTTVERDTCAPWLDAELAAVLPGIRCILALGGYGWDAALRSLRRLGVVVPAPRPRFGHAAEARLRPDLTLIGSYHPSQQNTFTGRLTEPMLDTVLARARAVAGLGPWPADADTPADTHADTPAGTPDDTRAP
ncbi:MAG: uracil-DNA glycosylase [Nocardioidaceae bacterium]